jgi:hypothetical protein
MKRMLVVVTLCSILGTSGFASAKKPAWVTGKDAAYPEQSYILGVGLDASLNAARSAARAEIAKVFRSHIVQAAESSATESTQSGSSNAGAVNTRVFTEGTLEGVSIVETWQDKKSKMYYALAVLDKRKIRQTLAQKIEDQEQAIRTNAQAAEKATSIIERIRLLTAAITAWNIKDELIVQKRVVDPVTVPDLPSGHTKASLEKQRDDVVKNIVFVIDTGDNQFSPLLASSLSEKITALGMRIIGASTQMPNDAYPITVKCRTSIQSSERNNPTWKFFAWQGSLDLVEGTTAGKTIGSVVRQGESAHTSLELAQSKANTDATQAMAQALYQQLRYYIFGDTKTAE